MSRCERCVAAELRESLSRVGSDLKQRIIDSVKSTWKTINDLAHYRRDAGDDASVSATDIDSIVSETVSNLDDASSRECTVSVHVHWFISDVATCAMLYRHNCTPVGEL